MERKNEEETEEERRKSTGDVSVKAEYLKNDKETERTESNSQRRRKERKNDKSTYTHDKKIVQKK